MIYSLSTEFHWPENSRYFDIPESALPGLTLAPGLSDF